MDGSAAETLPERSRPRTHNVSQKRKPKKPIGRTYRSKDKAKCGICGLRKTMTRAHVPPKCAGNANLVKRHRWMTKGNTAGRPGA